MTFREQWRLTCSTAIVGLIDEETMIGRVNEWRHMADTRDDDTAVEVGRMWSVVCCVKSVVCRSGRRSGGSGGRPIRLVLDSCLEVGVSSETALIFYLLQLGGETSFRFALPCRWFNLSFTLPTSIQPLTTCTRVCKAGQPWPPLRYAHCQQQDRGGSRGSRTVRSNVSSPRDQAPC